jgi:hypothetical protein
VPSPSLRRIAAVRVPTATVTELSGVASWFASPIGVSAAGPALRAALGPSWRGQRVTVTGPAGSAVVVLGDWCGCTTAGEKLIDLDDGAFVAVCGPLSRGVCDVEVTP